MAIQALSFKAGDKILLVSKPYLKPWSPLGTHKVCFLKLRLTWFVLVWQKEGSNPVSFTVFPPTIQLTLYKTLSQNLNNSLTNSWNNKITGWAANCEEPWHSLIFIYTVLQGPMCVWIFRVNPLRYKLARQQMSDNFSFGLLLENRASHLVQFSSLGKLTIVFDITACALRFFKITGKTCGKICIHLY